MAKEDEYLSCSIIDAAYDQLECLYATILSLTLLPTCKPHSHLATTILLNPLLPQQRSLQNNHQNTTLITLNMWSVVMTVFDLIPSRDKASNDVGSVTAAARSYVVSVNCLP